MPPPVREGPNRRRFLRQAALLAAGTPALAVALGACSQPKRSDPAPPPRIAAPDKPVTWDIQPDNAPIADGLGPEKGAPLHVYSYAGYISPEAVKAFEKRYGVEVRVSTFNNTEEALSQIRAGEDDYDIYTPSYDQIGRLVGGELIRPLNHSYVPNVKNLWPVFANPWYDREWRYTVPYTVYTTGIGWRADDVQADIASLANPYAVLWDRAYKGKTAVIDDWHTAMAMVLLKLGISDVNTSSAEDLQKVGEALTEMRTATAPGISVTMFGDLPAGLISVAQMWSGDIINAKNFLPEGVGPDILRYWFPADGRGLVENDLLVALRGGRNPVLAHLFINHMLDAEVARTNFAAIGYQPPQISLSPDSLVGEGLVPENLKTAIVRPEYFDVGYRILELDPANDAAWQSIWREFKTGRP
jgi:spermidine/putrescine transport system substrate-binding protein